MTERQIGFAPGRPPVWVGTLLDGEVQVTVFGTTRIEGGPTGRAGGIASGILVDRELRAAGSAKDRSFVELISRPDGGGVSRQF